jgi:hypothetical protein
MKPIEIQFMEKFPSLKQYMYEDIRSKSVFNSPEMQEILLDTTIDKTHIKQLQLLTFKGIASDDIEVLRNTLVEIRTEIQKLLEVDNDELD